MKRSKFSLSNYKLLTCDMGELIPVGCYEVLPGDTFQHQSSALIRCSPLVAPVMHPVQVRLHHWYVPMRLLWDGFENFITGGTDGAGDGVGNIPTFSSTTFSAGDVADYLGVPPGIGFTVSKLPFRAYNTIYNEFYRDQDLVSPVSVDNTGLHAIAWEKDRYTSARPWPQRGSALTVPVVGTANVQRSAASGTPINTDHILFGTVAGTKFWYDDGGVGTDVNLTADMSTTAVEVDDLRTAFALQRYREARARYGARYTEYLRYLGVTPADSRLQRPEYLGGGKQTIAFSEVLQTAEGTNAVGTMRGHGITAMRSGRFRKFFPEHGYVMTLMSVRPKTMYIDGVHKKWTRVTKEQFWQKELEHIGQDAIYRQELKGGAGSDLTVFGYQDRYDEYREEPSTVAGEMRSSLNFWHMARGFASPPALNSDFTNCVPSKRNFAVQTNDVLWCMVHHRVAARRLVTANATPKLF